MKNVCVIVKKRIAVKNNGEDAVIRAFSCLGYDFQELRVLLLSDAVKLGTILSQLKSEYENILLLSDKAALSVLRECAMQGYANTCVSELGNAGIFSEGQKTLFLLSTDETETGVGFVHTACKSYLERKYEVRFEKTVLRCIGANEDRIRSLIADAQREFPTDKVRISHSRRYDEDIVEIVYDSSAPKMAVDGIIRSFAEGLEDTMYALNDVSLEERLVEALKLRGKKLSVAESFTGGGLAKRITSVSGASEVYFEGLNTYAEESKIIRLGVSEYGLRTMGAVSDQTAYEMALGLLNTGNCDIAVATTGLAGPKTDRSMLPVGLCYIAVGTKEKIVVYRYKFPGNRTEISEKAINYALFLAYKALKTL